MKGTNKATTSRSSGDTDTVLPTQPMPFNFYIKFECGCVPTRFDTEVCRSIPPELDSMEGFGGEKYSLARETWALNEEDRDDTRDKHKLISWLKACHVMRIITT